MRANAESCRLEKSRASTGVSRLFGVALAMTVGCAGCMTDAGRLAEHAGFTRYAPRMPDVSPNIVELHYIVIERPIDHEILNETIWSEADEQVVSAELREDLRRNGLRIARLGSRLSSEMMNLLEDSNDTGQGRRHSSSTGTVVKVQTTEVLPRWSLFRFVDGEPIGEEFEQVQGYLHLTPCLSGSETVHVDVLPVVEYGPRIRLPEPAPDLSGWQVRNDRKSHAFQNLRTEFDVESGDYLLFGCLPESGATLGRRYFVREEEGREVQQVLLVRIVRPSREALYAAGYDFDDFFLTPIKRLAAPSPAKATMIAAQDDRPTEMLH